MGGIKEWNGVSVLDGSQDGSCRSLLAMSHTTSEMIQNSDGAAAAPKGKRKRRNAKVPRKTMHWTAKVQWAWTRR